MLGGVLGLIVISIIVGLLFRPALFVIIPLGLIGIASSAWENGVDRMEEHQYSKKVRRNAKAEEKRKVKLRKEFDEHELFEFDRAWKETYRNAK